LSEVLKPLRESGQRFVEQNALQDMSAALRGLGRLDQAVTCGERAVDLALELGSDVSHAQALAELAVIHRTAGHPATALTLSTEAAAIHHGHGDHHREALARLECARASRALDRPTEAAAHYAEAARLFEHLGLDQQRVDVLREATNG